MNTIKPSSFSDALAESLLSFSFHCKWKRGDTLFGVMGWGTLLLFTGKLETGLNMKHGFWGVSD